MAHFPRCRLGSFVEGLLSRNAVAGTGRLPALKQIDQWRLNRAQLPFGHEGPVSVIEPPLTPVK
jgi:hypothetical protein